MALPENKGLVVGLWLGPSWLPITYVYMALEIYFLRALEGRALERKRAREIAREPITYTWEVQAVGRAHGCPKRGYLT